MIESLLENLTIRRSLKARYYSIKLQPHSLTLVLPKYGTKREGLDFLSSKRKWIVDKLLSFEQYSFNLPKPQLTFLSCKEKDTLLREHCCDLHLDLEILKKKQVHFLNFFFNGQQRFLSIEKHERISDLKLEERGNFLRLQVQSRVLSSTPKEANFFTYSDQLQIALERYFLSEIESWREEFEKILNKKAQKISFSLAKTRWGSCSSRGSVRLNLAALLCPKEVRRSLVAHEFSHLLHLNHNEHFYNTLLTLSPRYLEHDKYLKKNGWMISYLRAYLKPLH